MAPTTYRYELRNGETIAATGHLTYETPLELGDTITIGKRVGVVRELGPRQPEGEYRLVVQLLDEGSESTA
jgi:hypothetical protein